MNFLIEVSGIFLGVLVGLAALIGLTFLIILTQHYFATPSKKQLQEYARGFLLRLQNPDFDAIEKHFGCPLPQVVRALYRDKTEIMRSDFFVAREVDSPEEDRWYIGFYQPADAKSLQERWPGTEQYFAFADNGCGDSYLVDPRQPDPPVFFHYHETGEIDPVCDHFTEFMDWPRLEET